MKFHIYCVGATLLVYCNPNNPKNFIDLINLKKVLRED